MNKCRMILCGAFFISMVIPAASLGDCERFEHYPQHALYGFNDIVVGHTNISQCTDACIKLGESCKSLDFTSTAICLLSSEDQYSQPKMFGRHLRSDYYQKVCRSQVTTPSPVTMDPDDCKTDAVGRSYTGKINHTVSGRTCQNWDRQIPHRHGYKYSYKFPDGRSGYRSNYCRNPQADDIESFIPWCYTTDPAVRWEYCFIPECKANCRDPCYRNPCGSADQCFTHHAFQCRPKFCGGCQAQYALLDGTIVNCTEITVPPPFTSTCRLTGRGKEYMGTLSTTITGKTCQRWDSQSPHTHSMTEFIEGTVGEAENYCRNPASHSIGLWCYTTDPRVRWERCQVPRCATDCRNTEMTSLGEDGGIIRCYYFVFNEQDKRSWTDAQAYCSDRFQGTTTNLALKRQHQLETVVANAKGYVREVKLRGSETPANVTVWYESIAAEIIPPPRSGANGGYWALQLWPGDPTIVSVSRDAVLGFICNEQ